MKMKKTFSVFLLSIMGFYLPAQDCKIDDNPITPIAGLACKESVTQKNIFTFYSIEGVTDSLMLRFQISDLDRRVINLGDSTVVLLKNNYKMKLFNIREHIAQPINLNYGIGTVEAFSFVFTTWISKKDVEQISKHKIQYLRFYSKIEETFETSKTNQHKKKNTNFTNLISYKNNLRQLAKCALEL